MQLGARIMCCSLMWNDPCIPIFQNIANQIWTPCCMFGQNAPSHTVLEYRCIFLVWTHEGSPLVSSRPMPPANIFNFFAYGMPMEGCLDVGTGTIWYWFLIWKSIWFQTHWLQMIISCHWTHWKRNWHNFMCWSVWLKCGFIPAKRTHVWSMCRSPKNKTIFTH